MDNDCQKIGVIMWKNIFFYHLPEKRPQNAVSHAQLPTALILGDFIRIFFASRNQNQYSSVYYVDFYLADHKVTSSEFSQYPVLVPGDIGTFDEHGVFPSSIVSHNGKFYMYYIGWNKGVEPPLFYASIGLAFSEDGEFFKKFSHAPIISRSNWDPCLVTSPNVYIEGNLWRMTYVSGIKWTRTLDGKLQSHYHIKYAESEDGINWKRNGHIAVDFHKGETNIARSSVIKDQDDSYKMWYCYIHSKIGKYRIGFAKSNDGYSWERKDDETNIVLDDKHATDMICYPCVFFFKSKMYMLYNGDNFGQMGFGLSIWE